MIRYNWSAERGWDAGESSPEFTVTIHGLSNVLHYGQGIFEGLKPHMTNLPDLDQPDDPLARVSSLAEVSPSTSRLRA